MRKVYKITEAQLKKIVYRVLNEDMEPVPDEGGGSTKPSSSPMSKEKTSSLVFIVFNGKTLNWVENGKVVKQWNAWSGRTKWNANTPYQRKLADNLTKLEFMKVKKQGPTPQGNYTISSVQARTNGNSLEFCGNKTWEQLGKIYNDEYNKIGDSHDFNSGTAQDLIAWGNYRLPISKKGDTETFGRGSFYLHGGGIAGSIGCIDLVDKIDEFVQYYKQYLSRTGAKGMDLIVDYSNKVNLDTNRPIPMTNVTSPNNVGDKRSDLEKRWDDQNSPENRGKLYGFQKLF